MGTIIPIGFTAKQPPELANILQLEFQLITPLQSALDTLLADSSFILHAEHEEDEGLTVQGFDNNGVYLAVWLEIQPKVLQLNFGSAWQGSTERGAQKRELLDHVLNLLRAFGELQPAKEPVAP